MPGVYSAAGKESSKSVFAGQFGGGEKFGCGKMCLRKASSVGNSVAGRNYFGCGKSVFEKRLREVIRWRGEIRLREKCLRKTSSRGNSVAEGNSAAGKVSSPDHINVSSKKVFGGARKVLHAMPAQCIKVCIFHLHFVGPAIGKRSPFANPRDRRAK